MAMDEESGQKHVRIWYMKESSPIPRKNNVLELGPILIRPAVRYYNSDGDILPGRCPSDEGNGAQVDLEYALSKPECINWYDVGLNQAVDLVNQALDNNNGVINVIGVYNLLLWMIRAFQDDHESSEYLIELFVNKELTIQLRDAYLKTCGMSLDEFVRARSDLQESHPFYIEDYGQAFSKYSKAASAILSPTYVYGDINWRRINIDKIASMLNILLSRQAGSGSAIETLKLINHAKIGLSYDPEKLKVLNDLVSDLSENILSIHIEGCSEHVIDQDGNKVFGSYRKPKDIMHIEQYLIYRFFDLFVRRRNDWCDIRRIVLSSNDLNLDARYLEALLDNDAPSLANGVL